MTFTIVARCPETGALGICLATSPLAVASRCPHLRPGVAAISSQCHTNWRLGLIGLDLAGHGLSPTQIIEALRSYDPHFEYRQVGIVTADGAAEAHSPPKGADWTGHRVGDGFVAIGNGLAGPQVVDAIHDGFAAGGGVPFPERLLRAIEAGYTAGGEPIGQSSAGLMVGVASSPRLLVDIRIDMANPLPRDGGDAVRDLRRAYDAYAPLVDYYTDFWLDHPDVKWRDCVGRTADAVHGASASRQVSRLLSTSGPARTG